MSEESVERARQFALKWAFDHNFNWPKDEPSERTYDGDSSLKMMAEFADSEKRETVSRIAEKLRDNIRIAENGGWDSVSVEELRIQADEIEAEFGGSGTGEK